MTLKRIIVIAGARDSKRTTPTPNRRTELCRGRVFRKSDGQCDFSNDMLQRGQAVSGLQSAATRRERRPYNRFPESRMHDVFGGLQRTTWFLRAVRNRRTNVITVVRNAATIANTSRHSTRDTTWIMLFGKCVVVNRDQWRVVTRVRHKRDDDAENARRTFRSRAW